MTQPRRKPQPAGVDLGHLPLPQGMDSSSKWLIAAVLAAGKEDCECDSCKLLKKFGGSLSSAMLQEGAEGGD